MEDRGQRCAELGSLAEMPAWLLGSFMAIRVTDWARSEGDRWTFSTVVSLVLSPTPCICADWY